GCAIRDDPLAIGRDPHVMLRADDLHYGRVAGLGDAERQPGRDRQRRSAKPWQWLRVRSPYHHSSMGDDPHGGYVIDLWDQDVDVSADVPPGRWFHLFGTRCVDDLPRAKYRGAP